MKYPRYPDYRASGVDWLGEVPTHWGTFPLKRAFRIVNGATPASGELEDEPVLLSTLIDRLNERFGTQFTPADQLFFDSVEAEAVQSAEVNEVAQANTFDDFSTAMEKELEGWFIDRMEGNDEVFRKVMADEGLRRMVSDHLLRRIYDRRAAISASGVVPRMLYWRCPGIVRPSAGCRRYG